jgi:AcrR family transcriptional regulator
VTLDISPADLPIYQYKGDADLIRAGVIDLGAERITLSDLGRRAGVSRMTVYDCFGNLHDVMRALMTLGFGTLFDQLSHKPEGEVLPPWQ